MEYSGIRNTIIETGRLLLREGLVARTWGNISARIDGKTMLITPSGLGYPGLLPENIAVYNAETGEWAGTHEPSGEKGVHAVLYEIFPEAKYVIHTHQTYASTLGVAGFSDIVITREEENLLGGVALAKYGLPGSDVLQENVKNAICTGAHTVLMKNHGVVIASETMELAFKRAIKLEEISKRSCKCLPGDNPDSYYHKSSKLLYMIQKTLPFSDIENRSEVLRRANEKKPVPAFLDDMAQMIGRNICVCSPDAVTITKILKETHAVLVPGAGAFISGDDPEDTEALKALVYKSVITAYQAETIGCVNPLSQEDCDVMRRVYVDSYSKRKKGEHQ